MRKITQFFLCVFVVLIHQQTNAQIGIGTTNPDPSSILDVSSNTQGLLVPRMSTSDRTSISSPTAGLMVYDTDLDAFMFYEGSWHEVANSTNVERNNYKLIKSVDDLADELVAGGGTSYQLTANTYYEINGSITLAFPIDLNEAYISGLDANEDRLIISGGTIFSGSSGGSIRNLTLVAVGSSIFNLTGTGAETLVFQNCIVSGFGATTDTFGSITNFNIVFFNIINIGSLDGGVTYTNINNLLLSNVAWFDSNAGTYETYVGTFDLIEKISGFTKVSAGATGIDVSANPTVGAGNLIASPFAGAGAYVDPYTVGGYTNYNFNNAWEIDCPGLPIESDATTSGYYYMVNNVTATSLFADDTPVKIEGVTTSSNLFRTSSTDNRLTYLGTESREFEVICTGTMQHTVNNARRFEFYIYKNGVQVSAISAERRFSRNDVGNFSMTGVLNLAPNDYIEVWVSINNVGSVPSCLIERLSVVLK